MKTHLILIDMGHVENANTRQALMRQAAYAAQADRQTAGSGPAVQNNDEIVVDSTSMAGAAAAIRVIRATEPCGTRIIVADAHPTWMHARDCFRSGADDYISLPQ